MRSRRTSSSALAAENIFPLGYTFPPYLRQKVAKNHMCLFSSLMKSWKKSDRPGNRVVVDTVRDLSDELADKVDVEAEEVDRLPPREGQSLLFSELVPYRCPVARHQLRSHPVVGPGKRVRPLEDLVRVIGVLPRNNAELLSNLLKALGRRPGAWS